MIAELVHEVPATGMLSLAYVELIPVLIKAIQEQQAQIEALKQGTGDHAARVDAAAAPALPDPRLDALAAEMAALRQQSKDGTPWLPLAAIAIGLLGAGFGMGRLRRTGTVA